MHMNPVVREAVVPVLSRAENFELIEPLDYGDMASLMAASDLVVTDSGGMVEEGVSIGVHVVILRNVTERPEGVELGLATLAGTEPMRCSPPSTGCPHATASGDREAQPNGDGDAAVRIASGVAWRLGLRERPASWEPDTREPVG